MTTLALPLIVLSAIMHAYWNLIAKRAKTNGVTLVWLFGIFESIIFLPLVIMTIYQLWRGDLAWSSVGFMVGSGMLHTVYFWLLSSGYRVGDLSIVYPMARGTGPLLSTIGAILFLSENPTTLVISGTIIICVGVIILTGNPRTLLQSTALAGIAFGLLTGVSVAVYTLWDAYAMTQAAIPPLMYQGGVSFTRMMVLIPFVLNKREGVRASWKLDKGKAFAIAFLSSTAYLIILFVLQFTPVSYVAPMRTLSILIGVLMGANILKEEDSNRRVIAAIAIIIGVIFLNIG